MRYPDFLSENGKLGFIAPSFGCATEPYKSGFQRALKVFHALSHECVLGPNCYESKGIGISNTPAKCGEEVMDMFANPSTDVLISCGGGELMCEVLDYIDFDALGKGTPKWFMGYSDNTNLTYLLPVLSDTAAIYGPCAATFGMDKWDASVEDAYKLLRGQKMTVHSYPLWELESIKDEEHPFVPYNLTEQTIHRYYFDDCFIEDGRSFNDRVTFSGRLIGGCLDNLAGLVGTTYDKTEMFAQRYAEDGIIWFLEACDLTVFGIRRALWLLEHAGWFSHVKGFLIGRAANGDEMMGLDAYQAVIGVLGKYKVPIVMDADIGHRAPMMPLISGAYGTVCVKGNDISVSMQTI